MNLKEAVFETPATIHYGAGANLVACRKEVFDALLAAARKQLAEEEAKKPKRRDLKRLETSLRDESEPTSIYWEAADILKALREQVVPWIRNGTAKHGNVKWHYDRQSEHHMCDEMLRALGEEV